MFLNDHHAEVVFGVAEGEDVVSDRIKDFVGIEIFDFVEFLFEVMGRIQFTVAMVFNKAICVENENVTGAHQVPFVNFVFFFKTENAFGGVAVNVAF